MLIDDVSATFIAGRGGDGSVSFLPRKGGPAGGNGGKGGDIYLEGTNDIEALKIFKNKKIFRAEDGGQGGRNHRDGKNGRDLYIKIPLGTRFTIDESDWIYEMLSPGSKFLLAKGGFGGKGNDEFKSATNQAPEYAEKGEQGQEKFVHFQMRLIADIGFIGLPNAGKSSLLASLTNAKPKIADYPFTTLEPNLGIMGKVVLADIPGLIEGASRGKGLGVAFLKHIEKTNLLGHCIDVSGDNILHDYETVRLEFKNFNPELLKKKEIIILTKTDLVTAADLNKKIQLLKSLNKDIVCVSILNDESLNKLREELFNFIKS